jgi:hypothetical protein
MTANLFIFLRMDRLKERGYNKSERKDRNKEGERNEESKRIEDFISSNFIRSRLWYDILDIYVNPFV